MKNIYWAAINSVPGIGSKTLRQLYGYFHDGEKIWTATREMLEQSNCLGSKTLSELIEFRQKISIDKLTEQLKHYKIKVCIEIFTDMSVATISKMCGWFKIDTFSHRT